MGGRRAQFALLGLVAIAQHRANQSGSIQRIPDLAGPPLAPCFFTDESSFAQFFKSGKTEWELLGGNALDF